jgi:LCP family protein required for cell wall assembly
VVVAIVVVAALVVALIGFAYVAARLGSIHRVAVAGIVPVGPGSPQTILLTGSDSRAGESAAQAQHFGSATQVAGQRSDVIVLIHLYPSTGKASMLSIPRDTFLPIAGTSSSNRINVAFNSGPGPLVATIEQDLGITINHYAQEDFSGLQGVTDAVGGVCMTFPYPVRDGSPTGQGNESGLNVPVAGRRTLNGAAALSLVRSRYYQYFANGTWHAEGNGDIGRIQRQHSFMRALASKAIHSSLTNPFTANAVLSRAVKDVTIDNSYTDTGLIRMALNLRGLHPSGIPSWTLPYRAVSGYGSYGDVLLPDQSADAAVIAAWKSYGAPGSSHPAPTVSPSQVTVRVLNGSGVSGQAARTATSLRTAGFSVAGYGTAPSPRKGASLIAYGPGQKGAAQALAAFVGGPVSIAADQAAGSTVVLTTGSQFTGVAGPPPAAGAAAAAPAASTGPPWDPTPC